MPSRRCPRNDSMASKSKRKIGLSEAFKRMNRSLKRKTSTPPTPTIRRQGRAEKSPIYLYRGDPNGHPPKEKNDWASTGTQFAKTKYPIMRAPSAADARSDTNSTDTVARGPVPCLTATVSELGRSTISLAIIHSPHACGRHRAGPARFACE